MLTISSDNDIRLIKSGSIKKIFSVDKKNDCLVTNYGNIIYPYRVDHKNFQIINYNIYTEISEKIICNITAEYNNVIVYINGVSIYKLDAQDDIERLTVGIKKFVLYFYVETNVFDIIIADFNLIKMICKNPGEKYSYKKIYLAPFYTKELKRFDINIKRYSKNDILFRYSE